MTEEEVNQRLQIIHDRLKWIANAEERAAWVGGLAARGIFEPERDRLIERAEALIDELIGSKNA